MTSTLTDKEIIAAVLLGNQRLFAELVNRYQNFVFTICLRYTNNREDAEDLSQESFVKAYRSLSAFRGDAKFSTWLYSIVNSICISFLRKKKFPSSATLPDNIVGIAANDERYDDYNQERLGLLQKTIAGLCAGDAQLLALFYKRELSLQEIGDKLNVQPNTVKVRLHRARTRLKKTMQAGMPMVCN